MPNYDVIVGNIGTVKNTTSKTEAERTFDEYVDQSKNLPGARCYGEDVTIMKDGEPCKEHTGSLPPQKGDTVLDLDILTNYTITKVNKKTRQVQTDGHTGWITIRPGNPDEHQHPWECGNFENYAKSLHLTPPPPPRPRERNLTHVHLSAEPERRQTDPRGLRR